MEKWNTAGSRRRATCTCWAPLQSSRAWWSWSTILEKSHCIARSSYVTQSPRSLWTASALWVTKGSKWPKKMHRTPVKLNKVLLSKSFNNYLRCYKKTVTLSLYRPRLKNTVVMRCDSTCAWGILIPHVYIVRTRFNTTYIIKLTTFNPHHLLLGCQAMCTAATLPSTCCHVTVSSGAFTLEFSMLAQ